MALILNEEQVMLRDTAAAFLQEKAPVAALRALRDQGSETGYSEPLWREMADMGWAGIAIPEAHGGLGYGYTGLGLVLEQAGRTLAASPLEASVLCAATALAQLATAEQQAAWLPGIAAGDNTASLALQEGPHFRPAQVALAAVTAPDGYCLSGSKQFVLDAHTADAFVVIARSAGQPGDTAGLSAFWVPRDSAGLSIERRSMVDSRNAGVLHFDNVQVTARQRLGAEGEAWPALERALDIIAIGMSAQLLGVAVEAFEQTVSYLKERQQFGTPIGSFQALQHRAALLFAELELARSVVLQALQAVDADAPELAVTASAAKAKLCDVAELATSEAIQMHGGVGMTDEYDVGLFLKRARVLQHSFGDYNYHLDRFARLGGF